MRFDCRAVPCATIILLEPGEPFRNPTGFTRAEGWGGFRSFGNPSGAGVGVYVPSRRSRKKSAMTKLEAVIQPSRFDPVKEALREAGVESKIDDAIRIRNEDRGDNFKELSH